jgi:hypothetical protein
MSFWSAVRRGWERSTGMVVFGGRDVSKAGKAAVMRWEKTPAALYDE